MTPGGLDFHLHSTASDGRLDPAALVAHAGACGVRAMALTDHDTTEGVGEAAEAALRLGLRLVPGVEISVTWHGLGMGLSKTLQKSFYAAHKGNARNLRDYLFVFLWLTN